MKQFNQLEKEEKLTFSSLKVWDKSARGEKISCRSLLLVLVWEGLARIQFYKTASKLIFLSYWIRS